MGAPIIGVWRTLNWPNRISLLRLLGVPPFVVLLLNQGEWAWARYAALGVFISMGFSDALDGFLARHFGQLTRLGKILDPLADKALITCAVILLATRRASVPDFELPNWVVVTVVGKDLWVVVGFLVIFLVTGRIRIRPTLAGKACTVGQVIMVAGVLASPDINRFGGQVGTRLAGFLGWAVMALCILAASSYTRLGLAFVSHTEAAPESEEERKKQDHAVQSDQ